MSKIETAEKLGSELVQEWRGSLRTRPPPVEITSPYWPGKDRKYADLTAEQIPRTESLMDCMERTEPLWEERILYELRKGRNVLVVAHANTLRGLVKLIDNIGDDEIQGKEETLTQFCSILRNGISVLCTLERCGHSYWNSHCVQLWKRHEAPTT